MEENTMLDKLKEHLSNTSKEELKAAWESGKYLDKSGFKVVDWLRSKGKHKLADEIEKGKD